MKTEAEYTRENKWMRRLTILLFYLIGLMMLVGLALSFVVRQ